MWKHLVHPNIVPLLGVTVDPLQLVSDRISGGNLLGYITKYPDSDRLGLVRVPSTALCDVLTPFASCLISPKASTTSTPAM